VITLEKETRRT